MPDVPAPCAVGVPPLPTLQAVSNPFLRLLMQLECFVLSGMLPDRYDAVLYWTVLAAHCYEDLH